MQARLLILDDDLAIGQTIGLIAESVNVRSHITSSPDEFFRQIEEWNPTDLAIDLVMPEMDGVQVLAELARRNCRARDASHARANALGRRATWA